MHLEPRQSSYRPLDLDRITLLSQTRPEVIDRYLRLKIRQVIRNARPESKLTLERLQFRIDAIRRRSGTPLAACIQMSRQMHQYLWELNNLLLTGCQNPDRQINRSRKSNILVFSLGRRRERQ